MNALLPLLLVFLAWGGLPTGGATLAAQEALVEPGAPESGERYSVFLLTMDQGERTWERFGHNAILIHDAEADQALTWNWGLFDFGEAGFLLRFLRGDMRYSMGPADLEPFLRSYVRADRTVYSNEIHLTQEQAGELDELVRRNFLPENRHYSYDYYRDNCSTRIRDVLDRVLGGAIRDRFADRLTERTYRWHSRRLVQEDFWLDHGLSFGLGTRGDVPITAWEAMFVPMELMEIFETMQVPNPAGGTRPLLGPRDTIYHAVGPPTPETAPSFSFLWLAAGLGVAGAFAAIGQAALGGPGGGAGRAVAIGAVLWGLAAGLLGLVLFLSWFTGHVFMHRNVNILYAGPHHLVLAAALLPVALTPRRWGTRVATVGGWIAAAVAALTLLGLLLQVTGLVHQGNAEALALFVPTNLALAWAVLRVARTPDPAQGPPREPA